MAITVNYYPPMQGIAQTAYGAGQAQGNLQQQQLGLQVEGLAQRERMQDQDLAFRGDAMQFGAAVDRRNILDRINAQQQSQAFDAMARERLVAFQAQQAQQAQAVNQIGRERLAAFDYGTRQSMLAQQISANQQQQQQQFEQQKELEAFRSSIDVAEFESKLSAEGQAQAKAFQQRVDGFRQWARDSHLSEDSQAYQEGMHQLMEQKLNLRLERYWKPPEPPLSETVEANKYYDQSTGISYFRDPVTGEYRERLAQKQNPTLKYPVVENGQTREVGPTESFVQDGFKYYISPETNKPELWPHEQARIEQQREAAKQQQEYSNRIYEAAKDIVSRSQTTGESVGWNEALEQAKAVIGQIYGSGPNAATGSPTVQQTNQDLLDGSMLRASELQRFPRDKIPTGLFAQMPALRSDDLEGYRALPDDAAFIIVGPDGAPILAEDGRPKIFSKK